MKNKKLKMARLSKAFPGVWMKDGKLFDHGHGSAIWSGEGSVMPDGLPAFNMYDYSSYVFGVHPELAAALEKLGLFAEAYDGGTFFFYEI
jgi:hypothetical protein